MSNQSNNGGIGILGLLGVVFVTLKLCGVIDWSWWWVTAPFWGGLALVFLFLGAVYAYVFVGAFREERSAKERMKARMERFRK